MFHHADGFNSHASAPYHFDIFKFFFKQLDNRIIFGSGLDKFQKQAVFPRSMTRPFKGFRNLKQLDFFLQRAISDFHIENFLHADKNIRKINDSDNLHHAV